MTCTRTGESKFYLSSSANSQSINLHAIHAKSIDFTDLKFFESRKSAYSSIIGQVLRLLLSTYSGR